MSLLPLVSVVIPAFNAARTLRHSIDSVLGQSYENVEVVVVNDGSKDETGAIIDSYGPTIRSLTQVNGGLASARNAGTRIASGELVAMFDADDLCDPDRLRSQVDCLVRHPQMVLCSTEFSAFDERGAVADAYSSRYYNRINELGGLQRIYPNRDGDIYHGNVYDTLVLGNFVHPPTVMFRRQAFAAAGPFDETLRLNSDWEWFIRAARIGEFGHVDRPLLSYRLSVHQMSGGRNVSPLLLEVIAILERTMRDDPSLLQRQPLEMRRKIGRACLAAARASADEQTVLPLRLLARSVANGVVTPSTLRVLVRALMPHPLVRLARARRRLTS